MFRHRRVGLNCGAYPQMVGEECVNACVGKITQDGAARMCVRACARPVVSWRLCEAETASRHL